MLTTSQTCRRKRETRVAKIMKHHGRLKATEITEGGTSRYMENVPLVLLPYVIQSRSGVNTPKGDL